MLRTLLLMATLGQAPPDAGPPPPAPPANAAVQPGSSWRPAAGHPGWEVFGVVFNDGVFRYSNIRPVAKASPTARPLTETNPALFGVVEPELAKIPSNSYQATGPAAAAFVAAAKAQSSGVVQDLRDDSRALRLTVSGTDAERAAFQADRDGPLKADLDGILIQTYPAEHWATTPVGMPPGHPSIVLETADGTVLHRQADYEGGAARLRTGIAYGKARKPDPNYDPSKDPGPATGEGEGVPDWAKVLGVGAIAIFVLSRLSPKGNAP